MNYREMYAAVESADAEKMQAAMLELLGVVETAATAVLELAGHQKQKTGEYPLMDRSHLILGDFIGLITRAER